MNDTRIRLLQASADLQELAEHIYKYATAPELTPLERSQLAASIGRVAGIGVGIGWIAEYGLGVIE